VVAARLVSGLMGESDLPPTGSAVWGDTQIILPSGRGRVDCRNVFTDELINLPQNTGGLLIPVGGILKNFPVALCLMGESPAAAGRSISD
jgi:hypothetical protein